MLRYSYKINNKYVNTVDKCLIVINKLQNLILKNKNKLKSLPKCVLGNNKTTDSEVQKLKILNGKYRTNLKECKNLYRRMLRKNTKLNPKRTKYQTQFSENEINMQEVINQKKNWKLQSKQSKSECYYTSQKTCAKQKLWTMIDNNQLTSDFVSSNPSSFKDSICDLSAFFNKNCVSIHEDTFKYKNSQLVMTDLMYALLCKASGSFNSMASIRTEFIAKNIAYVTEEAIRKKLSQLDANYLRLFWDQFRLYVYQRLNKMTSNTDNSMFDNIDLEKVEDIEHFKKFIKNIYATDGTFINLNKEISKSGFGKNDKNNKYSRLLLNGVHNLSLMIPENMDLSKDFNESNMFLQQLENIDSGCMVLGDGHYCTKKIIEKCTAKKINFIFRAPKNIVVCKNFLHSRRSTAIYDYVGGSRVRLIKYKYNNNIRILMTNLIDKAYSNNFIKELYGQRWFIEDFFRVLKYKMHINKTNVKTKNRLLQEVYANMILFTLSKYIQFAGIHYMTTHNNDPFYKINESNAIDTVAKNLLYKLMYTNEFFDNTQTKILYFERIVFGIITTLVKIEDYRFESRTLVKPPTTFIKKGAGFTDDII